MDLSNIADQLDNFKTVMGALAELTKLPQGILNFINADKGFSSEVVDFKGALSSTLSSK